MATDSHHRHTAINRELEEKAARAKDSQGAAAEETTNYL